MSVSTRASFWALSALVLIGAPTLVGAATEPTTGATAAAPAVPGPALKKPKVLSDDQIVCKYETPSGSRLGGHKVCLTRADWAYQHSSAVDAFRNSHPIDVMSK